MILRKPYAFLIKNFKKIHIFMLFLCAYIFYKNSQVRSFVSEFLNLGSYDRFSEPIGKYISIFLILALLIVIVLSTALTVLLKRKNKPWKLYLIPVIEYSFMLVVFLIARGFFNSYDGGSTTGIRAIGDLLLISSLVQYPVFIILLIRIFGIDLNNFNFQLDKEYLELNSEDREEFEININVDKHSFIRGYKRLFRNIGYIYQEHKFLFRTVITLVTIILVGYSYYNIFVLHRSYRQGDNVNSNGYTIRINNSYYTDKDYRGKVISKKSNFVILNLDIKNNYVKREVDLTKFHIINGINNYGYTVRTYETDFDDLGKTYSTKELKYGESINMILIFKVDKKLPSNRFVLYYQEYIKGKPYLRKIKLNIEDLSKIKFNKNIKIGKTTYLEEGNKKKDLNIEKVKFVNSISYSYEDCDEESDCSYSTRDVNAVSNEKIMQIEFLSESFEGKDLIDFSVKYGKIIYIDNKGKSRSLKVKDVVNRKYMGQYIYVRVPKEVENSKSVKLVYTVRNKRYTFRIK